MRHGKFDESTRRVLHILQEKQRQSRNTFSFIFDKKSNIFDLYFLEIRFTFRTELNL